MSETSTRKHVDGLIRDIDRAVVKNAWSTVQALAEQILTIDPTNDMARSHLNVAKRQLELLSATEGGRRSFGKKPLASTQSLVAARYAPEKVLSQGDRSTTYRAHDTELKREAALVLLRTEGLDQNVRSVMLCEARAMTKLGSHPNVVTVQAAGDHEGQLYLVTDPLGEHNLKAELENAPDRRLTIQRTVAIGAALCRGLIFAHSRGIIHRRLKPADVWPAPDTTVRIGGFGLADAADRAHLLREDTLVDMVFYLSPEQATGGKVDAPSDLYSLGVMLYEMIVGRPPFAGDTMLAIIAQHINTPPIAARWLNPLCPPALEALVEHLLAKNPAQRPKSAT